MKKLILYAIACILSTSAYAEEIPSLTGLGTIGFAEGSVENPLFPLHLEKIGDNASAILEWQRIIYDSSDTSLKTRARIHLARLQIKEKRHHTAMQTLRNIGAEDPASERMPEALYLMSVLSDLTHTQEDGIIYRNRIKTLYPESTYLEQAERHALWYLGIKGKNTFPDVHTPVAQTLKTRLELTPATHEENANNATLLSLAPGAGHLYLGDWRTALMAFIINAIMIWALMSALRKREWAYSTFFGLIVSILYIGTMFSAHSLAHRNAYEARIDAMKAWGDLAPQTITPIEPLYLSSLHPARAPLWAYRNIIGTFDGDRGNGSPVNSAYAKQAYDKHGIALGTVMMVDRLLRDWREIEQPMLEHHTEGRLRYVDPLARNDFWINS